ncbi:TIGR04255 family protein [Shewanella sp. 202IG2-18]|uniref:TIGR04255 family protein n=1 Tax=Parashewanella hymeniacidonis TaxID=2807618 RepID=UPI00196203D4|nr:TIGR04255 family protein [Parashewanella hymeniacidonis]MBM7073008.1 TIGR04255 family protein [Parashewanella hymeniacidonis]
MVSKSYQHAPLLMTIVDVRFSDIPDFYGEGKLVQLESLLREIGFVEKVIEKQQAVSFELTPDSEGRLLNTPKPTINPSEKQRWIFLNLDRTLSVFVAQDGLSIKSTDYTCHENYVATINQIISKLTETFPSLLQGVMSRIGTRYLNLIVPKEGKTVGQYLNDEWLPNNTIPTELEVESGVHNRLMMNYKTKHGNLRIESNKFQPDADARTPSILPSELMDSQETALIFKESPWWWAQLDSKESYVILDIDLSNPMREMFNSENITRLLNEMRSLTRPAFNMCITDEAKQDWIEL